MLGTILTELLLFGPETVEAFRTGIHRFRDLEERCVANHYTFGGVS